MNIASSRENQKNSASRQFRLETSNFSMEEIANGCNTIQEHQRNSDSRQFCLETSNFSVNEIQKFFANGCNTSQSAMSQEEIYDMQRRLISCPRGSKFSPQDWFKFFEAMPKLQNGPIEVWSKIACVLMAYFRVITQGNAGLMCDFSRCQINRSVGELKKGKLSELYTPKQKTLSAEEKNIEKIIKEHYPNRSPKLVWRNLNDPDRYAKHERINIGYKRLYRLMIRLDLWRKNQPKSERPPSKVYRPRARAGQFGELVQMDACRVSLLNGNVGNLYCFIDDATGQGFIALCRPGGETYANWADAIRLYIEKYRVPQRFYSDHFTAISNNNEREAVETELRRKIERLGTQVIFASSPEAKGRIERRHQPVRKSFNDKINRAYESGHKINAETLEDILVAVNKTLNDLPIEPREPGDLHQGKERIQHLLAMLGYADLSMFFARENTRTVRKNGTLQLNNLIYHLDSQGDDIPKKVDGLVYTDERVIFRNPEDGKVWGYRVLDKEQKYSADISAEDVISGKAKSPEESLKITDSSEKQKTY